MEFEVIVILTNTLVMVATFITTLYRIKIESDQIKTIKKNATSKQCFNRLRKYIKSEYDSLTCMNKEELKEFLEYLEKLDIYE